VLALKEVAMTSVTSSLGFTVTIYLDAHIAPDLGIVNLFNQAFDM
jgi:hypothetical protein